MAFDGIVTAAVKNELTAKIIGGRIEKIYQPEKDEVVLSIHNQGAKFRLLISANAQDARFHFTSVTKENPMSAPMFCMVLRKHLEGARILAINQLGLERILHINFSSIDEIGEAAEKKLIIEIMGKHSNIILVDASGNILDGIKRYSHAISRHREVLPGRAYITPPEQNKLNPLCLSENEFEQIIINTVLETKVNNCLLNNLTGISPLMSREIVSRANLPAELRIQDCGDYEIHRIWASLQSVIKAVTDDSWQPAIYYNDNKAIAFSAIELVQYYGLPLKKGTISAIIDFYFSSRLTQNNFKQKQNDLLKVINEELTRNFKKIAIQDEAIAEAGKADEYRIYGELLTANLYRIDPEQNPITVTNFYDPDQADLVIQLDARLSPSGNAQAYFKKYNKAKNTLQNAQKQKEIALTEVNYLQNVQQSIILASTLDELKEIRDELVIGAYVKEKLSKNKKRPKKEILRLQPITFVSSDGIDILAGKNNRQNDLLTLKNAKDNDIWLHVKDIPGSHVIIKNNGQPVPEQTLLEAALVAAYYSKARESSNVPVDYTAKKHVHKPNGAKPGMVIYTDQKTIFITPDENIIGQLLERLRLAPKRRH